MTPDANWRPDDAFLLRVKSSYRAAVEDGTKDYGQWTAINDRRQSIHDALLADDSSDLRAIFSDPASTDLFYGTDNLFRDAVTEWAANPQVDESSANQIRSDLHILLCALGLHRVRSSEISGDQHDDLKNLDIEGALTKLDHALNQKITFPNPFRGEFGLQTTRGLASYRAVQALYQAARVRQAFQPGASQNVLEIGPGLGRTAFYAFKSGVGDYSTIDLPLGVVAQACFLGATIGPEHIWMIGDDPKLATGRIKLYPSTWLQSIRRDFNVVLNVDSLTEMSLEIAMQFFNWIGKRSKTFISINHEENIFTVSELAASQRAAKLVSRSPYWMRKGYIEEVFSCQQKTRAMGLLRLLQGVRAKSKETIYE